jgi:hypothetical protein
MIKEVKPFSYIFFFCYLLLVFTEPGFYIFYTHDGGAQISFFIFMLTVYISYYFIFKFYYLSIMAISLLFFMALEVKETYILSAFGYYFFWFIFQFKYKQKSFILSISPFVILFIISLIILFLNVKINSPFLTNFNSNQSYLISLDLDSITTEFFRYAKSSLNIFSLLSLFLVFLFYYFHEDKKIPFYFSFTPILLWALAILPNSLIPNHHFLGYSWNGAYLIFLPILLLARVKFEK